MMDATPILCPHGKATSWTGSAVFGERLPECEHCPECTPEWVELEVQDSYTYMGD